MGAQDQGLGSRVAGGVKAERSERETVMGIGRGRQRKTKSYTDFTRAWENTEQQER
jgi:hypothetical protein